MLESALIEADRLDKYLGETGKTVGPLHGVPISLKDQFFVEGYETSVGFVAWLDGPAKKEDEDGIVPVLRAAGAVFHVKTNVPTSVMVSLLLIQSIETVNYIIGRTSNPYNRNCSAGGSSGGEGSLLAQRGAPLGVGTDIGGSVRIPSSLNGLWGLKASPGRFSPRGKRRTVCLLFMLTQIVGQLAIPSVIGPMGKSLAGLELFTKLSLAAKLWEVDPEVVELPWRPYEARRRLVFGLLLDDGCVAPQPPIRKALEQVADTLREAGHEVIKFTPPSHQTANELWVSGLILIQASTMTQCGGNAIHALCEQSGEPLINEVGDIMGKARGDRSVVSAEEVWKMSSERVAYTRTYDQAWNATANVSESKRPMDVLLMPNTAAVSWERGGPNYLGMWFSDTGYTAVVNVLQYTSLSMPLAKAEAIPQDVRNEFYSEMDKAVYEACMYAQLIKDSPEKYAGMPIGIQMVGRRFQEEKVLAIAKIIESIAPSKTSGDGL